MNKLAMWLAVLLLCGTLAGRERKENDSDLIYDEAKIPHYNLPELLVSAEGKAITTADDWKNIRRPQIMALFSNLIYGRVPGAESPIKVEFDVKKVDSDFMDGKATRKDVRIRLSNAKGRAEMLVLVFVPNDAAGPVPAFMKHSFDDTKSRGFEANPTHGVIFAMDGLWVSFLSGGMVLWRSISRILCNIMKLSFCAGYIPCFTRTGRVFPRRMSGGCWLRLRGVGCGRWIIWRRMLILITNEWRLWGIRRWARRLYGPRLRTSDLPWRFLLSQGCAGAALWRRRSGETLEKMVTRFPYWLCRNSWKFLGQEDDLPVDQHMLLACMPRPVYVHSGVDDTWADGRGEYLSAYHASEVYRLLGKQGLTSEDSPPVNQAIIQSDVGYHIRKGGHSIEMFDWQRFLDFADYHLKKKE